MSARDRSQLGDRGEIPDRAGRGRKRMPLRLALALTFLAAAAIRVWGAWAIRYIADVDSSVVALMARHMAAGREWPVFFYGQTYMGTLEPMVSALLVRVFGPTGFAVNLGPSLLSLAALAMLYVWAKDAGGPRAGLAATALCVIGPRFYFAFQLAPRGGYVIALFTGTFLLWKSARISARSGAGRPVGGREFFLLGLVGGLGFWSHSIIISAVLTATVILLIGWRGAFWRYPRQVMTGLAGGAIGLAPWWIYNLAHGWVSLRMLDYLAGIPWRYGIQWAWHRWIQMTGLAAWPAGYRLGAAWGYLVLAAAGVAVAAVSSVRRRRWDRATAARTAAVLFIAISAVFYIRSHYVRMNTARYLVPVIPALALFWGTAIAAAPRVWQRRAAAGLGLLLLASQTTTLPEYLDYSRSIPNREARQEALREALEAEGVRTIYAPLQAYHLNFTLGEAFTFTESRRIFYMPYYEEAEFSDEPAYLMNHAGINHFLETAGGEARRGGPRGYRFHFALRPPRDRLESVPGEEWRSVEFNGGPAPELSDLRVDTGRNPVPGADTHEVEIRFSRPAAVRRLRLAFQPLWPADPWNRPAAIAVDIQSPGGGEWREVLSRKWISRFYWSGPRPFESGRRHRVEVELPAEPAGGIRARLIDPHGTYREVVWRLIEVSVFEAAPGEQPDEVEALPELSRLLEEQGINRLYADRWESNRVFLETGGRVKVILNEKLPRPGGIPPGREVAGIAGTAFLPRAHDAGSTKRVLRDLGWAFREFPVGPWTLLVCGEPPETFPPGAALPLYWTGYALRAVGPAGVRGREP